MKIPRNLERRLLAVAACGLVLVSIPSLVRAAASDAVADALAWRLVGPHRAGWSTTAAGIPGDPATFYFGAAGGGVWKTTDAGRTWSPIFDDGPAAIGVLAVAPSDPKTIYVGTGQVTSRYDIAAGDGVFKTRDAGATWAPIGLGATRHIGAIVVDPRDAGVVLVAALGHVFGPNPERGVYRSEDGGATWQRTLYVSDDTGAVDLAVDPGSPDLVFASVWQVRHKPWLSYFLPGEGAESGVYRSADGGRTWARIHGGGWPDAKLGRIGLAATRAGGALRIYATVASTEAGGLYRSDDDGGTWKRVNDTASLGSSYFSRLTVMPGDPDTVFVMGQSIRKCTEGGAHCEIFKGSPGGDDYHDLWIDPAAPERMISVSDQGTAITVNAGRTWSSWYNQPTGQFYHLATDDRFPYRIYSGQQDNGTVSIASRGDYGSISFRDWRSVGADERDDDVPDPRDPDIVYGSGLGGRLTRWNAKNGEVQNISPWPLSSYGARPTTVQYHYTWITPIAVSKVPPFPMYQGAQVLFRSFDKGAHWSPISPDATLRGAAADSCVPDLTAEQARRCGFGVVFSIGLSPRDNDTLWVGTDDGRVRVTRDAGKRWTDVTPDAVPTWAKVSTLDVSALDPSSVYIAVDNHRQDDFAPYAFRTHDGGKTWTAIAGTLPPGHFVAALRADPRKAGLLYAGTDRSVFVSFDDGDHWRPLRNDLPSAIVNDLLVHGDDLIAATQGRAIWILDDVAPLRERVAADERAHLFAPAPAVRVRRNQNKDTPLPPDEPLAKNPPAGAIIDYWLAEPASSVALEIRDARGAVVRRFESGPPPAPLPSERYFAETWLGRAPSLSPDAGAHRFVWDLRGARPRAVRYEFSIAAVDGEETPLLPQGMLVPPGDYRVRFEVDGNAHEQPLRVVADPRVAVERTALESGYALSRKIVAAMEKQADAVAELKRVKDRLDAKTLAHLTAKESDESPNLDAIGNGLRELQNDLEESDRAPTDPQVRAFARLDARLSEALKLLR